MKRVFPKTIVIHLALALLLGMFTACGSDSRGETGAEEGLTSEAVTAQNGTAAPMVISFQVNGGCITFEDGSGKSIQQLLEQAGITLNEGDTLSFVPDQVFPGDITFQVLRQHTVSIIVAAQDPSQSIRHTAVLMEGTVADAIAAVGVELAEDHSVNYDLNTPLTDGMEILIYGDALTDYPPVTTPSDPPYENTAPTEPDPSPSDKTIVSIEIYEDCDGSGHGIKVITYSDGTQEEVLF